MWEDSLKNQLSEFIIFSFNKPTIQHSYHLNNYCSVLQLKQTHFLLKIIIKSVSYLHLILTLQDPKIEHFFYLIKPLLIPFSVSIVLYEQYKFFKNFIISFDHYGEIFLNLLKVTFLVFSSFPFKHLFGIYLKLNSPPSVSFF